MTGIAGRTVRSIRWVVAVVLVVLAASILPAGAVGTPAKVIGGAGEQYDPFVSGSLVAYSTWASKHAHAFVRDLSDASTTRIEASGQAEANGFDPVSGQILYTRWDGNTNGNLYLFDPATSDRTKVAGVNTGTWEWDGRISSTYLLFLQDRKTNGVWYLDVRLMKRSTGKIRTVASYRWKHIEVVNTGSVGDRYATWTVCYSGWDCRAMVYDAATPSLKTIPTKDGRRQYSPVVDEVHGSVYFTRLGGSRWCHNVNVWLLPVGHLRSSPTKVFGLADGSDTGWTSSLAINGVTSELDYYYERYLCGKRTGDIYVAPGVEVA